MSGSTRAFRTIPRLLYSRFETLPSLGELRSRWKASLPKISVLVPTHNHERWISRCLHGILMQRTVHPFEVLVRDDASQDETPEIVNLYASRYPGVIHLFQETRNTFQTRCPISALSKLATGSLTAYCEGDDFWIDSRKLEVQARLLLSRDNTSAVAHSALLLRRGFVPRIIPRKCPEVFAQFDYESALLGIPTLSLMWRNEQPLPEEYMNTVLYRDIVLKMWLISQGPVDFLGNQPMGFYRVHASGVWSGSEPRARVREALASLNASDHMLRDVALPPNIRQLSRIFDT